MIVLLDAAMLSASQARTNRNRWPRHIDRRRRLVLATALAIAQTASAEDWLPISGDPVPYLYIDRDSVRITDAWREAIFILNLGEGSLKGRWRFNCVKQSVQEFDRERYSGANGHGELVERRLIGDEKHVVRGGAGETAMQHLCALNKS